MIDANFAYSYVENIPWKDSPIYAFSNNTKEYLDAFERILVKVPNKDDKVDFYNNTWDFRPYFEDINSDYYKFLFDSLPESIRVYCKFYVLHTMMKKNKLPTINTRLRTFYDLINKILDKSYHKNFFLITTDDIIDEIENRKIKPNTKSNKYLAIMKLYGFFERNYKINFPVDLKSIESRMLKEREKGANDVDKVPNIPNEYYDIILSKMVQLMRDDKIEYKVRATACLTIILSQTGLRLSDLVGLKVKQLNTMKLMGSGFETNYIRYQTRKTSRAHSPLLEFNIFCTELCTEAYNTLIKIRNYSSSSKLSDFIYVIDAKNKLNQRFPVGAFVFIGLYRHIFYTYLLDEALKPREGINETKWKHNSRTKAFTKVFIPDTRQYRVHLCTELYEQGKPLIYIMRFMGHLTEQMMGYYVRPKDKTQENIDVFEKVIKELVKDDITPLGGLYGNEIKESIVNFINNNKFSIEEDIDAIEAKFGDKLIIRGKTGGVCIKTSLIPCSKDARSDEVLCAYNLCQNLFHFYYMVDLTFHDFYKLRQTYELNLKNGNSHAAQKELYKIISLCKQRLLPELEELNKEIERKGIVRIINKYPNLIDIIENRESIESEAMIWMKMN